MGASLLALAQYILTNDETREDNNNRRVTTTH